MLIAEAVRSRRIELLDWLLDHPARLAYQPVELYELTDDQQPQPLGLALNEGDIEGNSALHHAVITRQPSMVQRLLRAPEILVDNPNCLHESPLMLAVINNDEVIVNLLLNHLNVNTKSSDEKGRTALMHAAIRGYIPIVERLLNYGGAICKRDRQYKNAIDYLYENGCINRLSLSAIKIIKNIYPNFSIENPASLAVLSRHPEIILMDAASHFKIALDFAMLVNFALAIKHVTGQEGILQILSKYPEITSIELFNYVRFNKDLCSLVTPGLLTRRTASQGNLMAMEWLLKYSLENASILREQSPIKPINQPDNDGNTALHHAVINQHPEVVQRLLQEADIELDAVNREGQVPLLIALNRKDGTIIKSFLAHPTITNVVKEFCKKKKEELRESRNQACIALVEGLLNHNVMTVCQPDAHGKTTLDYLYENGTITRLSPNAIAIIKTIYPNFSVTDPNSLQVLSRKRSRTYSHPILPHQPLLPRPALSWNGTTSLSIGGGRGVLAMPASTPRLRPSIPVAPTSSPSSVACSEKMPTPGAFAKLGSFFRRKRPEMLATPASTESDDAEAEGKRPPSSPLVQTAAKTPKHGISGDDDKLTPLMCAVLEGDTAQVKTLLADQNTDVQAKTCDNQTALELLLELDEAGDGHNITPENFNAIKKLLLEHLVNELPTKKITLKLDQQPMILRCAAQCGRVDLVKQLLKQYPQLAINTSDRLGQTALILATIEGHADVVKRLLRQPNIKVSAADQFGQTALGWAVEVNQQAIVACLLSHADSAGALNLVDGDDHTPLMWAVLHGYSTIAEQLLNHPAIAINQQNQQGQTPLMLATTLDRPEMVALLLKRGAKAGIKDRQGQTALAMAQLFGHEAISKQLLNSLDKRVDIAAAPPQQAEAEQRQKETLINWLLQQVAKQGKRGPARASDAARIVHELAVKHGVLPSDKQCCAVQQLTHGMGAWGLDEQPTAVAQLPDGQRIPFPTLRPAIPGPSGSRDQGAIG